MTDTLPAPADTNNALPAGFARHYRQSPATNPWEPLYSRKDGGVVSIGFRAAEAHANSRGFVHGGLISALADNAMGLSCGETLGDVTGLVTVSLAVDFLGSANLGQWVEITPKVNRAGGRLCFAEALVTADGEPCAKAHATFSVGRKS
jgi:acyl-coenzyme A thioesterase PaaI-like protein